MNRRKRLRPVSNKRQAINDEWNPIREEYLREHSTCMRPGCNQPATGKVHELSRGNRGKAIQDCSTWLTLCYDDHLLTVHQHPKEFPIERQLAWKFWSDRENFDLRRALERSASFNENAQVDLVAIDVMDWLVRELRDLVRLS